MMMLRFVFCVVLLMIMDSSYSQLASGQWRDHLSYRECALVDNDGKSVVGVSRNGFFRHYPEKNHIEKYSKVNYLSGTGITAFKFLKDDHMVVGYLDGGIDIIEGDNTYSILDLKEKNMSGSKQINGFYAYEGRLYCCTAFGIMVVDVNKREIADVYYLGVDGESLSVTGMTVLNGFFYVSTLKGVYRAAIDNGRLWYYDAWEQVYSGKIISVASIGGRLIFVHETSATQMDLFVSGDDGWMLLSNLTGFQSLRSGSDWALVTTSSSVYSINDQFELILEKNDIRLEGDVVVNPSFTDAVWSSDKSTLWVADRAYGLLMRQGEETDQTVVADGPLTNGCHELKFAGNRLVVAPGARTTLWNNGNLAAQMYFYDGTWQNLSSTTDELLTGKRDVLGIAVDPNDANRVFFSSWGNGVFEVNDRVVTENYYVENSALQTISGMYGYARVGGMVFDKTGNLFMTNSEKSEGVVVKSSDGKWYRYDYERLLSQHTMGQMVVDENSNIWILVVISLNQGRGIYVFNTNGTVDDDSDDIYRSPYDPAGDSRHVGKIRIWDKNYEEVTSNVYCLTRDLSGYLWLGTDKGVLVNYSPEKVFKEAYPVFRYVEIPREDDPLYVDYLLESEKVTAITVDGANRKWIGTEASGVYLVSADGTRTIEHFTVDNSPLLSNEIMSIAIHPQTGEVFIGTGIGIVSFKGTATEGQSSMSEVRVYPNPVQPQYKGIITLSGMVKNSNVKIVDPSGNLVFETTSLGGQAVWNGNNMWGKRVQSGVYVVLVTSSDGSLVATGKILIVN
ncbi:type IX secretion system anionic LPS delivery protein PorZ [Breznakibacter xylanolyticus]|nr:T9SS type A sorting domain-containing protein [Breznakibacter xylanolyticus]